MKTDKIKKKYFLMISVLVIITVITAVALIVEKSNSASLEPMPTTVKVSTMAGYVSRYHPAHISSGEAWDLVRSNNSAMMLDVRAKETYDESHVSGAINVPPDTVEDYAAKSLPDKNSPIICYCYCGDNGGAAFTAYNQLTELGYTNVYYTEPDSEWTYEGTSHDETSTENTEHRIISGDEAKELYESATTAVLLDVRNQDEYDEMHIDGSVLIPAKELESRLSELPDKNVTIIVYCQSGKRSLTASEILTAAGYDNVYDMQFVENWPESLTTQ